MTEWFTTNDRRTNKCVYHNYREEISHACSLSRNVTIDLTSAFFNIQGWDLISEALSNPNISKVRIMIGSEPSIRENIRGKVEDEEVSESELRKRNEAMLLLGRGKNSPLVEGLIY